MNAPAKQPNVNKKIADFQRGTYGREVDKVDWTYYDTLVLDPAVLEYTLFNSSQGKDLSQTNYFGNGIFPQAQEFRIKAIKLLYTGANVKDTAGVTGLYTMMEKSTLTFQIQNKAPSYQKTLQEIFGIAMGFHFVPTVAGNNEGIMAFNRFIGIDPINRAIGLAALTPFTVPVKFYGAGAIPAAFTGDKIKVCLTGILRRLV